MKSREQFGKETLPVNRRGLHSIHRCFTKAFTALVVLALCGAAPAFAVGPCTVTSSLDDGGPGTLRALIADVNCDPINFQPGLASPIVLNGTDLFINRNLTINGPGAASLAIDGNSSSGIFRIALATASISGLTIRNGSSSRGGGIVNLFSTLTLTDSTVTGNSVTSGGGGIFNELTSTLTLVGSTVSGNSAPIHGGGIANDGTMTLTDSTVSGNSADIGGGIENDGTLTLMNSTVSGNSAAIWGGGIRASGTLTLTDSTISDNSAVSDTRGDGIGGGIYIDWDGVGGGITITNSTVSRNSASFEGGGIYNRGVLTMTNVTVSGNSAELFGGGIFVDDVIRLTNSTVVGNSAESGGGLNAPIGPLSFKNTIVAGNLGGNCVGDHHGETTSLGHNLSDTGCSLFNDPTDLLDPDLGLDTLQNNGGPTETHALLAGSMAINAVPIANCTAQDGSTPIATDQRGVARPQGLGCDIGAYEFEPGDVIGPVTSNVISNSNPLPVFTNWIITAAVSDETTGNHNVSSAEYQIDGGEFLPMDATDGAFNQVTEDVEDLAPAVFPNAGVFEVCVHGADSLGNVGDPECIFLPVYDPNDGFVTGGGWISSPAGACLLESCTENTTGKANFAFVSKYQKGANVPTGQTEFRFKAGDLNFHGGNYDWLVVAGARAQFKGTGTINGTGNYGFLLTAIDGALNGGGDTDRFRIKIWDIDNGGAIVYDNQLGAGDNGGAATELGGGSIIIHAN